MRDILLNPDYDLDFASGDLGIGDATYQHQAILLNVGPGEIKAQPTTGVGVESFLLDEDKSLLLREIRSQFTKDGMRVSRVSITTNGSLTIDATYK